MTSNCGENKEVAHEPQASVSLMFSPRFDFFCDPLLTSLMATWNLFFLGGGGGDEERQKAKYEFKIAAYHYTARGYICTSLRIFQVTNATFRPRLLSSSTYLYTVYLESFSKPSLP